MNDIYCEHEYSIKQKKRYNEYGKYELRVSCYIPGNWNTRTKCFDTEEQAQQSVQRMFNSLHRWIK